MADAEAEVAEAVEAMLEADDRMKIKKRSLKYVT